MNKLKSINDENFKLTFLILNPFLVYFYHNYHKFLAFHFQNIDNSLKLPYLALILTFCANNLFFPLCPGSSLAKKSTKPMTSGRSALGLLYIWTRSLSFQPWRLLKKTAPMIYFLTSSHLFRLLSMKPSQRNPPWLMKHYKLNQPPSQANHQIIMTSIRK